MIRTIHLAFIMLILIVGCESNSTDGTSNPVNSNSISKNKHQNEFAALPILFDSTSVLIHPVGVLKQRKSRGILSSESGYYQPTSMSIEGKTTIHGSMTNLIFQNTDSSTTHLLTDQNMKIHAVEFLSDHYKKHGTALLLYRISDADTNNDQQIDDDDLVALYISSIDGGSFKKLTPDSVHLEQYKIISSFDRLFVKTIKDLNHDGIYNTEDQFHYYSLDLISPEVTLSEYFPSFK